METVSASTYNWKAKKPEARSGLVSKLKAGPGSTHMENKVRINGKQDSDRNPNVKHDTNIDIQMESTILIDIQMESRFRMHNKNIIMSSP
jgi:hypothetical protein